MGPRIIPEKTKVTDWCVAGFTLVLAVVAILQWITMSSQLNVARIDERAWLQLKPLGSSEVKGEEIPKVQVLTGQEIIWPLKLVNIGKTSARNVSLTVYVEVLDAAQQVHLECVDAVNLCPSHTATSGILFPNTDFTIPAVRLDHKGQPGLVAEPEAYAFMNGKAYAAVYGMVTYDDVFHVHHWTKFCYWMAGTQGNFASKSCTQYSNVDDDN
jgi:hypothetical protein